MAIVTSDFLAAVLTNFQAKFQNDFDAARNLQNWGPLALNTSSTGQTETYEWFGTVPQMEDVTHQDLRVEGLPEYNYSITNLLWKVGIEVQRTALEDDRLGLITPRIGQLAEEAARHPGQLVFNLMIDNGNAYDGISFFNDTRVIGSSANIDNDLAGAGITVANIQTDLAAARTAMRLFQDDKGRVMNLVPNLIVVPPNLEQVMWQALNREQGPSQQNPVMPQGAEGQDQSGYQVIVNPFATDVDNWFLFHTAPGRAPFVYQTRMAPALEGITSPNTERGTIRDAFLYSARARYNAGYGEPRHGIRIVN